MKATFFSSPAGFRQWLEKNHDKEAEIWVGLYKKSSGKQVITYQELLDEALCFGWIDNMQKGIDDERYGIRFAPRKSKSPWTKTNILRVSALKRLNRMHTSGLKAYDERKQ